jgi:hypothetical protein
VAEHTPNQAIHSELQQVSGTDVITLRTIEKWTAAFDGARTDIADLPRSGRPRGTANIDAIRALIQSEGYLSQKKIAHLLGIHHETVKSIMRSDLNMRKVNFKWLPHALNNSQRPLESKLRASSSRSRKARQTEVCRMSIQGMRYGFIFAIPRRQCESGPMLRGQLEFDAQLAPGNICFGLIFPGQALQNRRFVDPDVVVKELTDFCERVTFEELQSVSQNCIERLR